MFERHCYPSVVNIDKSGANSSALRIVNKRSLSTKKIKIRKVKPKRNHQRIKRRISITTGFKEFEFTQRTWLGIEVVNIIKKGQIKDSCFTSVKTFCSLAA
jgi:putative transposase